jgi:hypothetical protein
MDICTICAGVIEGSRLGGTDTGGACHPACVAERLPQDAIAALIAAGLLALAPLIIVWAA